MVGIAMEVTGMDGRTSEGNKLCPYRLAFEQGRQSRHCCSCVELDKAQPPLPDGVIISSRQYIERNVLARP